MGIALPNALLQGPRVPTPPGPRRYATAIGVRAIGVRVRLVAMMSEGHTWDVRWLGHATLAWAMPQKGDERGQHDLICNQASDTNQS